MIRIRIPNSAELARIHDDILMRSLSEYQIFHENIGHFSAEEIEFREQLQRVITTLESEAIRRKLLDPGSRKAQRTTMAQYFSASPTRT